MSAALKSDVPRPAASQRKSSQRSPLNRSYPTQGAAALVPDQHKGPRVHAEPVPLTPSVSPVVLKWLSRLQLVSSVLATAVVGLALVSYGASVYVDRQLSQATQRLNALQRSEQQLTTANESLKSYMARQAESPEVDLIPPKPQQVIFLQPAHQRSQPSSPNSRQLGEGVPRVTPPMGY